MFFEDQSIKFKFYYNLTRITGTVHEERCTFMIAGTLHEETCTFMITGTLHEDTCTFMITGTLHEDMNIYDNRYFT